MRGPLIQTYIKRYKNRLAKYTYRDFYKWACLDNYKKHWDLETLDFYDMFDRSFSSQTSNRLWSKDQYYPKKMMLRLIKHDKAFIRHMFRDLFNDNHDLIMRMDRFRFHCDEMLNAVRQVDHSILAHYHEDYTMITTYLAFQFPEKYTIYEDVAFRSMLKLLGSQSNTSGGITKFMVLLRSLNENYLQKDRSIMDIYRSKLEEEFHHTSNSTMLVHDFYTSLRELSDDSPN